MTERVKFSQPMGLPSASLADHEIFLSFNDDDGAMAFDEWWNSEEVQQQFAEFYATWVEEN